MADKLTRIAIVSTDKCKPKKCRQECKKSCPVNRTGKNCIEVTPHSKISWISEGLCIGCGLCVKKCPFDAVSIINLPRNLEKDTTHRYSANSFKLHRMPTPRPGQVLGLVGTNGIGKSTALKILAGKLKPNLGKFDNPPSWQEILEFFRGSELQNYFTRVLEQDPKPLIKPQYVDSIPNSIKGQVGEILKDRDQRGVMEEMMDVLDLQKVVDRDVAVLSGGELQRFAIAAICVQDATVYMFDEPSSYLDVRQRLRAAGAIRAMALLGPLTCVIVVEHDLSVLDYLSDFVCCLYGTPGAYGVVTMPFAVRDGINIFLAGHIPTENLRFRAVALNFKVAQQLDDGDRGSDNRRFSYPSMTKTLVGKKKKERVFKLNIQGGAFRDAEILVMLGENGTGKTTFVRMLAGREKPDGDVQVPEMHISYKPQKINPKFPGTVRELLHRKVTSFSHPQFQTDVVKPMNLDGIIDQKVLNLSGGELQRVAMVLCLGTPADIYLIDEPSAYLDSEQRIIAARMIKRYILHCKKTAFVVEHDFIMATYLADRVIVYEGQPSVECTANAPQPLLSGMNTFLQQLNITFRRDPTNFRPRINKLNSVKDAEQKKKGTYFYLEDN